MLKFLCTISKHPLIQREFLFRKYEKKKWKQNANQRILNVISTNRQKLGTNLSSLMLSQSIKIIPKKTCLGHKVSMTFQPFFSSII